MTLYLALMGGYIKIDTENENGSLICHKLTKYLYTNKHQWIKNLLPECDFV